MPTYVHVCACVCFLACAACTRCFVLRLSLSSTVSLSLRLPPSAPDFISDNTMKIRILKHEETSNDMVSLTLRDEHSSSGSYWQLEGYPSRKIYFREVYMHVSASARFPCMHLCKNSYTHGTTLWRSNMPSGIENTNTPRYSHLYIRVYICNKYV